MCRLDVIKITVISFKRVTSIRQNIQNDGRETNFPAKFVFFTTYLKHHSYSTYRGAWHTPVYEQYQSLHQI